MGCQMTALNRTVYYGAAQCTPLLEEQRMEIGAVFPQLEIGNDPIAIRDYAQGVEAMGYTHLEIYDHVLGADTSKRQPWPGPYTKDHAFHEVFVLLGYLAGCTRNLGLLIAVLVLPQRQTALVAKQVAEIDVLSGGRMQLGVGVGWNYVEYQCLNEEFGNRGKRVEEQVEVLKALWTQEVVTYHGAWHHIQEAGINPLPVQRPVPIYFGGGADAMLRRVARQGDGWLPFSKDEAWLTERLGKLHDYAQEAGRDPATIKIDGRIRIGTGTPDDWRAILEMWQRGNATATAVNTMDGGFTTVDQHLERLREFREQVQG